MGFIVYIIVGIICGFITKSMNENKGYEGGFAWGFFLAIIGIIVVAVRPYARENKPTSNYSGTLGSSGNSASYSNRYETAMPAKTASNKIACCKYCKEVFVDTEYGRCPKCKSYLDIIKTNISEREWGNMSEERKLEKKAEWLGIDLKKDFGPAFKKKIKGTEFEQYLPLLEKNNLLEASLLYSLTSDELKEIGIESLGDRKKLLTFIKDFKFAPVEKSKEHKQEPPKEPEEKTDDWICPSCGKRNRNYIVTCPDCLNKRPRQ